MSSVEERVVSMKFDGNQFLAGVDKSLSALDRLNGKLKMTEGSKGLSDIGAAADNQAGKLSKIGDAVEHISGKFKSLGVIGLSALNTITSQAVLAGEKLLSSFSLKPITDGFHEYETTLNSIQTILSNTSAAGTNLNQVNDALNQLNHYADQTIYNFSEMAKNIGTFTAAGVDLKTSVSSIKGLANLAALSGSSAEQASTAMYQLSQAISSGKVSLEDWNSVVNAGMGGTVFQRALAMNAEKMGTLNKGAVKLTGSMKNVTVGGKSFRDSITAKPGEKSWLTSDVLTRTLSQFTGDLSAAQLKAEGFNAAEIKTIQNQAKMAKNAATQVKTFSQLVSTLGEAVGSGWTTTWQTIFGNFDEAKSLFTNVSNVLGGYVNASANARNKVLADWKAMGGRTAIINAVSNSFQALIAVVKPIREAFREIFPAVTGKQLASISKSIENFTKNLKIGGSTANELKRTFAGFFAILDIGWQIIKQVVKTVLDLVGVATKGSGGILAFTGNIGDFLVGLDQAIKKGDGLSNFFKNLGKFLAGPINGIRTLVGWIAQLVGKLTAGASLDGFLKSLQPIESFGNAIGSVWSHMGAIVKAVWGFVQPIASKMMTFFKNVGNSIAGLFSGINYENFLHTINTGLFAGLLLLLNNFIKKFKGGVGDGGGFLDTIKESFDQLTGALQQMQNVLKATTLLEIAAAVALLAIAVVALSKVDAKQLAVALSGMTVMFGQLIGTMILLQKFTTGGGAVKLPLIAAGFILLAAAVDILASAVVKLADLDWESLSKGLIGITVILGALVGAAQLMPDGKKMISSSLGMIAMAAAVKILASAVASLSGLSWEDLTKGLIGVGAILGALVLFSKFMEADKAGALTGAGILLMAVGIKILASALGDLGGMSWSELAKGLVAMGGALIIITGVMNAMESAIPGAAALLIVSLSLGMIATALGTFGSMSWSEIGKSMVVLGGSLLIIAAALAGMEEALPGAAALIVVALSLGMLAKAMGTMGGMSWSEIAKSLVELAGSLLIIAGGMALMTEALPGAAALVVVAAALRILTPVLTTLGAMTWGEIVKGLVALAAALAVIGIAAALLTPVIPSLLGLGIGIGLLGVAMALAGAGVFLFATGLTLLAASGAAAAGALVGMIEILLGGLPQIVQLIGKLLIAILDLIIQAAPKIGQAFLAVMNTLIDAIVKLSPKIINMILSLLSSLLDALVKYVPHMVDAGYKLITGILNGIAKNIGKVITAATNVIVAFLNGLSKNLPRVINAGLDLIVNFVNGIANGIRSHTAAMQAAGRNLASAIIDGITGGLASGIGRVVDQAKSIGSSAINAAKDVLGIHSPSKEFYKLGAYVNQGFAAGLKSGNKKDVDDAFGSLKNQISAAMQSSGKDIESLTAKLKKLEKARHKDKDAINDTKKALAQANKEHAAETAAYARVSLYLNSQHSKLDALATQYSTLTDKIKDATDAYNDSVKARDDFKKQITDQFSNVPTPTAEQSPADFIAQLKKQVDDTNKLSNELQLLRKQGLNDQTYKDLLAAGTSSLPFVDSLLQAGPDDIKQINDLEKQLGSAADQLGTAASNQLYQAGVDAAAGLVKGLQQQQAAIQAQMNTIANSMVAAIKKALGIKSPSRVFAEIGNFAAQGLSKGLDDSVGLVTQSAEDMAAQAVSALQKSLTDVSKMTLGAIDTQPTIRPVLDLTQFNKDATGISNTLSKASLSTSGAYSNAVTVSAAVRNNQSGSDGVDGPTKNVTFVQNNYSPKAISTAETYRNTKNQISVAKGAL